MNFLLCHSRDEAKWESVRVELVKRCWFGAAAALECDCVLGLGFEKTKVKANRF